MATISTHNGGQVALEHNRRNRAVTDKEKHIDREGYYEVWRDVDLPAAYDKIFGRAVNEYNEKQKRPERRIDNYLQHIKSDKKMKPVYEMIVGVYQDGLSRSTKRQIYADFVNDWAKRNPRLKLVGAYFHDDEEGDAHLHIDYIPVADGYKTGVSRRPGIDRALRQMGFDRDVKYGKKGVIDTPQIAWERRENEELERICERYGLTVEHPERGKDVEHADTKTYKRIMAQTENKRNNIINQAKIDADLVIEEKVASADEEINLRRKKANNNIKAEEEKARRAREQAEKELKEAEEIRANNEKREIENARALAAGRRILAEQDAKSMMRTRSSDREIPFPNF